MHAASDARRVPRESLWRSGVRRCDRGATRDASTGGVMTGSPILLLRVRFAGAASSGSGLSRGLGRWRMLSERSCIVVGEGLPRVAIDGQQRRPEMRAVAHAFTWKGRTGGSRAGAATSMRARGADRAS